MAVLDVNINRQEYIGGSDIAAVMGMSRYKTPLKLWAEKTGKIEPADLSSVDAVHFGYILENIVAQEFTDRTGKKVRKANNVYSHKEYPYMVAHIDRLIVDSDEILECKTCSAFKAAEWENEEIPQEYILQVIWYLGITGRRIGHIACLIGGQKFVYKQIEFDSELFDRMVDMAKVFWEAVQTNTPVAVSSDDDTTLQELYGNNNDFIIELLPVDDKSLVACEEFEQQVAYLQEVKSHIDSLTEEKKQIESQIKDVIKDNLGIQTPKYTITWKSQQTIKFDSKQFKNDNPAIYNAYSKVSEFRVLRIKANKEDK